MGKAEVVVSGLGTHFLHDKCAKKAKTPAHGVVCECGRSKSYKQYVLCKICAEQQNACNFCGKSAVPQKLI